MPLFPMSFRLQLFRLSVLTILVAGSAQTLAQQANTLTSPPPTNGEQVTDTAEQLGTAAKKSCSKPEWPKASLRNEEQGTVTMAFLISEEGKVLDSKIIKSSGFRDLDKAAVEGIAKCTFKPGLMNGKPEQGWMNMQYVWTLR